ncbi:MAG: lanthionine synthetase LanC family protein [Ignavibacteria bacterium]
MIETEYKTIALKEAIRIADCIYNKRYEDGDGIYWKTMGLNDATRAIEFNTAENIYSGVAGIAYFYLALFKVTQNEKYLDVCKNAMKWTVKYCDNNETVMYSFITGRMGIPYVLLKLSSYCGDNFNESVFKIVKESPIFLDSSNSSCEYLNGVGGMIVSLIHMYDMAKEDLFLKYIDSYTRHIIDNARYNENGMHWDRSNQIIRSLTGFSHGSAGIGFVFLELYNYFRNNEFRLLAEQAFKHENAFFDEKHGNWKDLRKGMYTDPDKNKHKNSFYNKEFDFFTKPSSMNAWCHGAAGIGLSRLRAAELTNNPVYKRDLDFCIRKVLDDFHDDYCGNKSYTLCHGLFGNLDFLNDALSFVNEPDYKQEYSNIIHSVLNNLDTKNKYISGLASFAGAEEDLSLFNGNAGIGYFFLRLADSSNTESILAPAVKNRFAPKKTNSDYPFEWLTTQYIKKGTVAKVFPRTLRELEESDSGILENYFSAPVTEESSNLIDEFCDYITPLTVSRNPQESRMAGAYDFESLKYEIENSISSYSLVFARSVFLPEINKNFFSDESLFLNSKIKINPDVRIAESEWRWSGDSVDGNTGFSGPEKIKSYYLLSGSYKGVFEKEISLLSFSILEFFEEEKSINEVMPELLELFPGYRNKEKEEIKRLLVQQIRNLIEGNVLLFL